MSEENLRALLRGELDVSKHDGEDHDFIVPASSSVWDEDEERYIRRELDDMTREEACAMGMLLMKHYHEDIGGDE